MKRSPQVFIGFIIAVIALFSYMGSSTRNSYTGKVQHLALNTDQEIAIGLQSAPEMLSRYGGESRDRRATAKVEEVGNRVVAAVAKDSPYRFQFHLLGDQQTINAFALPGGQVFVTEALLRKLHSEGELAGVLGHEIGHVVGRHGAQQLAKQQLTQGLIGATQVATYDPNNPRSAATAQLAQAVGALVGLRYGRDDELEADKLGVQFLGQAGYDPRAMLGVMETLKEASGGRRQPEFLSTHPDPGNRSEHIKSAIEEFYPSGVPGGLQQ